MKRAMLVKAIVLLPLWPLILIAMNDQTSQCGDDARALLAWWRS